MDYREARDIDARDEIPERRVRGKYVATGIRKVQQDLVLDSEAGRIRHVAVGRRAGARFITVWLHGQGGSRSQGVDDFTFGGNFNRIKNLDGRQFRALSVARIFRISAEPGPPRSRR